MKAGRPVPELLLSESERATLTAWTRRAKCPQALALRARVILLCASGKSNTDAAAALHITIQTVGKWRQRFLEKRIEGLLDEPRPGTPRKLSAADVGRVLDMTLESAPSHTAHWSTRSLAEATGLSRASIHRIWRAFSVEPRRPETFRVLKESLLADKST